MTGDWFDVVRALGVTSVAQAFGLEPTRGRGLTPCPACGAATRHTKRKDKRGAIGLTRDGLGWRCFQCDASGDAVTVATISVTGKANPTREQWPDVRRACAERGLCEADPRDGPTCPSGAAPAVRRISPPPNPSPVSLKRPPRGEVLALWRASRPVTEDATVTAWLESRGLDPTAVEDFDLARALPERVSLPRWARFRGRPWTETAHRLLVPMVGITGQVESLHARALAPAAPCEKAASPAGAEIRGLVIADHLARLIFTNTAIGDGTPMAEMIARVGLWIAEGLPDFLTLATNWSDADESAPAVLGVLSGSWTEALTDRVPDGCEVVIATDADSAGERYAERIVATLEARICAGRIRVKRWKSNLRGAA